MMILLNKKGIIMENEEQKILPQDTVESDKIEINSNVSLEQFELLQKQFEGLNEQINKHSKFIEEFYKNSAEVKEDKTTLKW